MRALGQSLVATAVLTSPAVAVTPGFQPAAASVEMPALPPAVQSGPCEDAIGELATMQLFYLVLTASCTGPECLGWSLSARYAVLRSAGRFINACAI